MKPTQGEGEARRGHHDLLRVSIGLDDTVTLSCECGQVVAALSGIGWTLFVNCFVEEKEE